MSRHIRRKVMQSSDKPPSMQRSFEYLYDEVVEIREKEGPEQALERLQKAAPRFQHLTGYLVLRGILYTELGDAYAALDDLEMAVKKDIDYPHAYLAMAAAFADLEFWTHARKSANEFLRRYRVVSDEKLAVEQMVLEASAQISDRARLAGLPLEVYEKASLPNERAQRFIVIGNYQRAAQEADASIRIAPSWASPRNNLSLALFYQGKLEAAMAEAQGVLDKIDANNIPALGNQILFHLCAWERDVAMQYLERLKKHLTMSPLEGLDLDKAIEALGFCDDDDALWELAVRLSAVKNEILTGLSWYMMGVAALHTGHYKEAKRFLKKALDRAPDNEKWIKPALQAANKSLRTGTPPVGSMLNGRFPYIHFAQIWPLPLYMELVDQLPEFTDDSASVEIELDHIIHQYIKRYPFVSYAGRQMLWENINDLSCKKGLDLMAASNHPAVTQELLTLVRSSYGSDDMRMSALQILLNRGQLPAGEKIEFWDSELDKYKEIAVLTNKIVETYEAPCNPRARRLIDKGLEYLGKAPPKKVDLEKAAVEFRRAIEIDPDCALALHNLASIYMQLGQEEEAETLVRRSVQVDPGYLFGYTTLAFLELKRENYQAGEENLDKVFSAPVVPITVMLRALSAKIQLLAAKDDMETAASYLTTLKALYPGYSELPKLEMLVQLKDASERWNSLWKGRMHRYRDRKLKLPITKDENLAFCLDRLSRESLTGTLRFWRHSNVGRKAALISGMIEKMTDPDILREIVRSTLLDEERRALTWVLERGGSCRWNDFTERFGDDYDESPYWQYHEPETIPGRLRMAGLLAVGTLDDVRVAVIPIELRSCLLEALKEV